MDQVEHKDGAAALSADQTDFLAKFVSQSVLDADVAGGTTKEVDRVVDHIATMANELLQAQQWDPTVIGEGVKYVTEQARTALEARLVQSTDGLRASSPSSTIASLGSSTVSTRAAAAANGESPRVLPLSVYGSLNADVAVDLHRWVSCQPDMPADLPDAAYPFGGLFAPDVDASIYDATAVCKDLAKVSGGGGGSDTADPTGSPAQLLEHLEKRGAAVAMRRLHAVLALFLQVRSFPRGCTARVCVIVCVRCACRRPWPRLRRVPACHSHASPPRSVTATTPAPAPARACGVPAWARRSSRR